MTSFNEYGPLRGKTGIAYNINFYKLLKHAARS